ncbi:MAG: glycosyltransferase family 4 protein [Acidobacteriota bacterium]
MFVCDLGIVIAATIASYLGILLFRMWSESRSIVDIPNERSSHSVPTPRGGGLIIVIVCLASYLVITTYSGKSFSWGYFAGATLVAAVSWLDDLYSIRFEARFFVHLISALLLVFSSGVSFVSGQADTALNPILSWTVTGLMVIWIVWLINAYNFMDGIDGIAGLQAIVAAIGFYVAAYLLNINDIRPFLLVVAGTSAGFLIQNWQPAKVFMGDVGSAFLGFTFAALPFLFGTNRSTSGAFLLPISLFFLWPFVFDTLFTLISRIFARKRFWEAHRQHLYQRMVIGGRSHASVALLYGAACALTTTAALLTFKVSGNFVILLIFSTIAVSVGLLTLAYRKKKLT